MWMLWNQRWLTACIVLGFVVTSVHAETNMTYGPTLGPGKTACDVSFGPPAPDCENLWAVQVEVKAPVGPGVADTGNPTCVSGSAQPDELEDYMTQVLDVIESNGDPAKVAHLAVSLAGKVYESLLAPNIGGDLGNILKANFAPRTSFASCVVLMAALPTNAQVVGKRLSAWDDDLGMQGCKVGLDCAIGYSKFPLDVQTHGQIRSILFQNWSDNRERIARMVIFFKVPPGSEPIPDI